MKTLPIIIAALPFATGAARAGPLPLPKPPGPGAAARTAISRAQDAVPKPPNGTCPWDG